jgi:CRP-like cAMP-binding protein/Fe-S-cluster-containing dehydrogenase component
MSSAAHAGVVALLGDVPFLAGVPRDELEALAENSVLRRCDPGASVVEQGEFGHSMFVLLEGALTITARGEDGNRLVLGRLARPGDFFGEVALLGRGVRSATVAVDEPAALLEIEKNRFDRLARKHKVVLDELEKFYHARSIATYTRLHRYLGALDERAVAELTAGATMRKFQRDEIVVRQGAPADTIMLVKDGVLKMVRRGGDGRLSILAYFNTHDVIGAHDPAARPADLVALGQAEIIYLRRAAFDALAVSHPAVYARFGKDDMHRAQVLKDAGATVYGAVQAFLTEGVEVESLLVINLDRCVRCGNCVRACHARHEFTRLDRRGPIFRRRVTMESTQHEHLLIPSSCRHCRDPECMIGCPTGAIHRTPDGEVDINDNCIGCDNCARKCPYGNITMMPLPEAQQKDGITKRAIKCNLCRGYEYSNCVYNCPRGAVLRVDPLRYFDELAMVMEPEQVEGIRWQREQARLAGTLDTKQRVTPRSTVFIWASLALLLLALGGIAAAYLLAPAPHTGGTPWGLGFGAAATACVLFAVALGARKRARNRSAGHLEVWTQFHMVVGTIGFAAALAHAGFRITGVFTTLLLLVFAAEVASGLAGQLIYVIAPRILTRLERGGLSKLIEDLLEEELELGKGIDELARKSPPEVRAFIDGPLARAAGSITSRYRRGYDPETRPDQVARLLADDMKRIPAGARATAERIARDVVRLGDVRAQLRLHRMMKAWLVFHLAAAGALVTLLVVHVAAMLMIM